jgi:hypothetical protein
LTIEDFMQTTDCIRLLRDPYTPSAFVQTPP